MPNRLEKTFCRGEVIIKEGQQGSTFFVILSGMVEVLKQKAGRDVVIGVLGPNEFFGEMSLLDSGTGKRSATVRALDDTRVAIMGKGDLENYLGKLTPGVRNLLGRLSDRLKRTSTLVDAGAYNRPKEAESDTLDFMMTLDEWEQARQHSVNINFMCKKFQKGQMVIRQGQKGQCGFIVKQGRLEVLRMAGEGIMVLGELKEGDMLGESAMFEDVTRSATVKALTDGEVMVFGKRDMLNMARQSPLELFMIIDSLSGKIEHTNENYCDAMIELEKSQKERVKLEEELAERQKQIEELRRENTKLSGELEKLRPENKQPPSSGQRKQV